MNPLTVLRKASMKELWQLMLLGMRYPRYIFPSLNATKKALSISQQYYGRAHSKNGPANAFYHGFIDAVIEPRKTRFHLIRALRQLGSKRASVPPKKHCNIPL